MELSVLKYWILLYLLFYIMFIPIGFLLFFWLDKPNFSDRLQKISCIKTTLWTAAIFSFIIYGAVFLFCRNTVSRIYIINSDNSVSEKIIACDFSEKFIVQNLTDKNVYEVAITYGRVGMFVPNHKIVTTISPNETAIISKKPKKVMTPIPDRISVSHPRHTPAPSRTTETFIISELEKGNL